MNEKTAVIIGAGPAGLTAAYELIERTHIKPIIYEMSDDVGGISRTVNYKGNRIDIGGHRFFSKSDRVMKWWLKILPLQGSPARDDLALPGSGPFSADLHGPDPELEDRVMLVRRRLSRIYFLRRFFDYPISLSIRTVLNLGLLRATRITLDYLRARAFPIKPEQSLEDFLINRFGRELYLTFFKDYTEKVWGVPCRRISPEWGAQRVKGLSMGLAVLQAARRLFSQDSSLAQKRTETSLIEQFLYPKLGPGQMWQEVAKIINARGGRTELMHRVTGLRVSGDRVMEATVRNESTGEEKVQRGDYFFSTMPVRELIQSMGDGVPQEVRQVSEGLVYRDFITVGLLLKRLRVRDESGRKSAGTNRVRDNWIYVQERDVKICRIQIFNNWSPYLVKDEDTVWIGLEYFCEEGDEFWSKPDQALIEYAVEELVKLAVVSREDVLDGTVIRMPKTYPAYLGTYDRFHVIRDYVDRYQNLFLIGRNGMHKYNNQDHSMLGAMTAVDNIIAGRTGKENIWAVNAERAYHEEKP